MAVDICKREKTNSTKHVNRKLSLSILQLRPTERSHAFIINHSFFLLYMWCKGSGEVLCAVCSLGLFTSSLLIGSTMGSR